MMFCQKVKFGIEQGLLGLLRTKPHRKFPSVVHNLFCTHQKILVLNLPLLANKSYVEGGKNEKPFFVDVVVHKLGVHCVG